MPKLLSIQCMSQIIYQMILFNKWRGNQRIILKKEGNKRKRKHVKIKREWFMSIRKDTL